MKPLLIFISALLLSMPIQARDSAEGLSGTLIVLNKRGDDASFIDVASGDLLATLPTGKGPHELVISDDGLWAVGTDYANGKSLTVFDVQNLKLERTIDLSAHPRPHGILMLSNNRIVIVTSEANRTVVLVDFVNNRILGAIDTTQGCLLYTSPSPRDS